LTCEGNREHSVDCQGAPQENFHGLWDKINGDCRRRLLWTWSNTMDHSFIPRQTLILPKDQPCDPLKSLFHISNLSHPRPNLNPHMIRLNKPGSISLSFGGGGWTNDYQTSSPPSGPPTQSQTVSKTQEPVYSLPPSQSSDQYKFLTRRQTQTYTYPC